jgi:hypothetical protein
VKITPARKHSRRGPGTRRGEKDGVPREQVRQHNPRPTEPTATAPRYSPTRESPWLAHGR